MPSLHRRQFIQSTSAAALLAYVGQHAMAQAQP